MKHKITAIVLAAATLLGLGAWGVAGASSFRSGNTASVDSGEVVDSSVWLWGRTIDIAGEVNGDVFCAGLHVTVSGTVRGDLLCAAQTVVVSGLVTGDVRSVAQTFTLDGTVIHNLSAGTQSYHQGSKGTVRGDLSAAGNDISVSGPVGRDVALAGTSVVLNGEVGRNVDASIQDLRLGRTANIEGDLTYTSQKNAQLDRGATVGGETTKKTPAAQPQQKTSAAGLQWGFIFYVLAAGLFIALTLVLLFPQAFQAVAETGARSFGKSLLVGLVAAIAVPVLVILLLLTVVGIPLALVTIGAWLLLQALAGIVFAYFLGRQIWRNQRNSVLIMLAGSIILLILYMIPIIGLIAIVAAMLLGTGMILLELNRRRPTPRYRTGG